MLPIELKIKSAYTMIFISESLATTTKDEIIITGLDEKRQRYIFKRRGSRKEYYLPPTEQLQERLFFEGHNLPLMVDTETNRFSGNACFNFVTDYPQILREFIKTKCLNPSPVTFEKILYSNSSNRTGSLIESRLFTNQQSRIR